jgi:hypothetical protein
MTKDAQGVWVNLHGFLSSALDDSELSAFSLLALPTRNVTPLPNA